MNNEDQQEPLPERLDRFENEFKAGKTPKLEDYVSSDSDILEVIEFIHIDFEQRFRKGQRVDVKDYIFKYPELDNHPNELLELFLLEENFAYNAEPDPAKVAEINDTIKKAMEKLKPNHRVLVEDFLRNNSQEKTAEVHGVALRTVQRAVTEFREEIQRLSNIE
jgi:hypothetical protein